MKTKKKKKKLPPIDGEDWNNFLRRKGGNHQTEKEKIKKEKKFDIMEGWE